VRNGINGGFKDITISNCVFESCRGFALESVDGALLEDITFVGVTMRDIRNSSLFLRLGTRMRGPAGVPVGTLKRVLISNVTSYGAVMELPSIISGVPGHLIEDIKINDVYFHQRGGGTQQMADLLPEVKEDAYPEPRIFGTLPAHGFFIRHVRNIEFGNVEIANETPDARPVFWLKGVEGADFFRVKTPKGSASPTFNLTDVKDFRVFGSRAVKDTSEETVDHKSF
jgi:polygalacturonase